MRAPAARTNMQRQTCSAVLLAAPGTVPCACRPCCCSIACCRVRRRSAAAGSCQASESIGSSIVR